MIQSLKVHLTWPSDHITWNIHNLKSTQVPSVPTLSVNLLMTMVTFSINVINGIKYSILQLKKAVIILVWLNPEISSFSISTIWSKKLSLMFLLRIGCMIWMKHLVVHSKKVIKKREKMVCKRLISKQAKQQRNRKSTNFKIKTQQLLPLNKRWILKFIKECKKNLKTTRRHRSQ